MAISWDDFDKIWASTSPLTPYLFSDNNYKQGWNFVGATPPARQMWDSIQKANDEKFKFLRDNFGTPNIVTTASQMTDTGKVYVYMGSEAGWSNGHWYYWNGTTWADGGVYNSVAFVTDTTLSIAGQPADAKATGDALALKSDLAGCTFTGNVGINADLSVTGDASIGTDLSVAGTSTLTGNINAGADISAVGDVSADNLTTTTNATVGGSLSVAGTSTLTGNVTTNGNINAVGDISSANLTTTNATIGGNATVTGDVSCANLTTSTDASVGGDLTVTGDSTLADTTVNDLVVNNDLSVAGDSSLTNLFVSGTTALNGNSTAITQPIDDNSTKIATTEYVQAEIKPIEADVSVNDKRISNIEKLLQGNLYDYQTDDTSAYTKTVPAGAMPYAGLEKIGGKTLVWNQLSQIPQNATYTYTIANNTYQEIANIPLTSGHQILFNIDYVSDTEGCGLYGVSNGTRHQDKYAIFTQGSTYTFRLRIYNFSGAEATVTISNINVIVTDLTICYGAGNEPTTVEQFREMFPADYYEYNSGELLSAGVTEVKSVGRNLFYSTTNSYSSTPNGIAVNWNKDTQTITFNGTNTKTDSAWISLNLDSSIDLVAGESYTISSNGSPTLSTGLYFNATYYDTNGTLKGFTLSNGTFTVPADYGLFRHVQIGVYKTATTINTTIKVQIEKGNTATEYVPYANPLATYPIPASIQSLDGYGWSAGSVYNYIDFERKKFVQNVGAVDLGTLTWGITSTGNFNVSIPNMALSVIGNREVMVNPKYPYSTTISVNMTWWITVNTNTIYVRDETYSTVSAFKSAMSGVYAYYELATPVETDISAYITDDNLIEVEAGGTLTFPNSNGDDYRIEVPSEETYMINLQEAVSNG